MPQMDLNDALPVLGALLPALLVWGSSRSEQGAQRERLRAHSDELTTARRERRDLEGKAVRLEQRVVDQQRQLDDQRALAERRHDKQHESAQAIQRDLKDVNALLARLDSSETSHPSQERLDRR